MIALRALVDALASHAMVTGHFDSVNGAEPKSAPAHGLTAAVWVDRVQPIPARSGLAATSTLLVMNVRVYTPMLTEPEDAIDPRVMDAVDELMEAYSGDFEMGGAVANVDLLGAHGFALSARAGYIEMDHRMFRTMTMTVPLVLNDVWEQSP